MKIALKHPITVDGKEITELDLRLEELTGKDVDFAAREAAAMSGNGNVLRAALVLDVDFHLQVAARASGLPAEQLRAMKAVDYLAIMTAVQGFLLDLG